MTRRYSIAPMMEWTDRHYRNFARVLSKHAFLYTEMVTTGALLHGDQARFLKYEKAEHPIALQLGGSKPSDLAKCAKLAEDWGYDEVNLNVGCPSDRVQEGKIGACLMAEPDLVAEGVRAMSESSKLPITVKTRLGLDDNENYQDLYHFVKTISEAGSQLVILHARNAWLKGLSPKQNRNIPPIKYDWVYNIKKDFPHLWIELNGGLTTPEASALHLDHIDSIMVGRRAYEDPWSITQVDPLYHNTKCSVSSRSEALEKYTPYVISELKKGTALKSMTRHLLGLFNGIRGAKPWRQNISSIRTSDLSSWQQLIQLANEIERKL